MNNRQKPMYEPAQAETKALRSTSPMKFQNMFFDIWLGSDKRPTFFDIDEFFPELEQLDDSVAIIREETLSITERGIDIPACHEVDSNRFGISAELNPDKNEVSFFYIC